MKRIFLEENYCRKCWFHDIRWYIHESQTFDWLQIIKLEFNFVRNFFSSILKFYRNSSFVWDTAFFKGRKDCIRFQRNLTLNYFLKVPFLLGNERFLRSSLRELSIIIRENYGALNFVINARNGHEKLHNFLRWDSIIFLMLSFRLKFEPSEC